LYFYKTDLKTHYRENINVCLHHYAEWSSEDLWSFSAKSPEKLNAYRLDVDYVFKYFLRINVKSCKLRNTNV